MMKASTFHFVLSYLVFCVLAFDDYDYSDDFGASLSSRIQQQVQNGLKPLQNLGSRIRQEVAENLKPLQNLGPQIQQQVHEGLRPVREMQSRFRVKFGEGGTTVAIFKDRKFIIRNGVLYDCTGTISEENGSCSGTLQRAAFTKKEDYCYANAHTIINDWYCFGSGGNIISGSINGHITCKSGDNSPTLLISGEEFRRMCGSGKAVTYKYFTTTPLGEHTNDIQCRGTQPHIVCTLSEVHNSGTPNVVSSGGSYVSIQT